MNRNLSPQEFGGPLPKYGDRDYPHRDPGAQRDLRDRKAQDIRELSKRGEEKFAARVGEEVELLDYDRRSGRHVPGGRAKFAGLKQGTAQIEFPDGHVEPRPSMGYRFLKG